MRNLDKIGFVIEYFGRDKSLGMISDETGIPISTLYMRATKQWGLTLRDYSHALWVSLHNGRGPYRNPPKEVDWKKFERLYYDEENTLDTIAPEFGFKYGYSLGRKARKEGYKLRKAAPRSKKVFNRNEHFFLPSV